MNREHVLAVILVFSLCVNVYFVFTDQFSLNPDVQVFVSTAIPGADSLMKFSPTSVFMNYSLQANSDQGAAASQTSLNNDVQDFVSTAIPGANISPDSVFIDNSSQANSDQGAASQTSLNNDVQDFVSTAIAGADSSMNISPDSVFIDNSSQGNSDQEAVNQTDRVDIGDGWTTYTSKKYAFSVRYPTTWEVNEGSTGSASRRLVLTAPPETDCDPISAQCFKYIASLTIEIDQDPETLSLEEYFNSAVASLQKKYAITSTSKSASCMLSGNRAYQIEFYTRDNRGNPDRSYMQYYTLIDKKGYIISYTGPFSNWEHVFAINKGDAQRIIDSFEVERIYEVV